MAAETSFAMHARMSMGNAARDAVAASLPPPALPGQRLISFLKANWEEMIALVIVNSRPISFDTDTSLAIAFTSSNRFPIDEKTREAHM